METLPLSELVPDPTRPCCDWSLAFGNRVRARLADGRYAAHTDSLHTVQRLLETGGGHALRAFKTFPGRRKDDHQAKALESWEAAIARLQGIEDAVAGAEDTEG